MTPIPYSIDLFETSPETREYAEALLRIIEVTLDSGATPRTVRGVTDTRLGVDFANETFILRSRTGMDCGCGLYERVDAWDAVNGHRQHCFQALLRERGHDDENLYGSGGRCLDPDRQTNNLAILHVASTEWGLTPNAQHCSCDYWERHDAAPVDLNDHAYSCAASSYNFVHLPSGCTASWRISVGRRLRVSLGRMEWRAVVDDCIASLDRSAAVELPDTMTP